MERVTWVITYEIDTIMSDRGLRQPKEIADIFEVKILEKYWSSLTRKIGEAIRKDEYNLCELSVSPDQDIHKHKHKQPETKIYKQTLRTETQNKRRQTRIMRSMLCSGDSHSGLAWWSCLPLWLSDQGPCIWMPASLGWWMDFYGI